MSESLPNAPLATAIFQLRFAGETAVETGRVEFQEATRDRLPKLYVPKSVPGQPLALQGYVFRSNDEAESVELAINAFTYYTTQYDRFAGFKERVLSYFAVFSRLVRIHRLTRVGLRYVNRIPILRASPGEGIPLSDYLNVGLKLPECMGGANLTELNIAFTLRMEGGKLRTLIQHEQVLNPPGSEVLVLDFDFAQEDQLDVDRLEEYLDRAHAQTKQIFVNLISPRYWSIINGEAS
jgi:uncharacterized protein (TIGR04255 family)